jgi:FAD-dependent urate hydroxylase
MLARAIAAAFYVEDLDTHYQDLLAYQRPELQGDEWTDAEALSQLVG